MSFFSILSSRFAIAPGNIVRFGQGSRLLLIGLCPTRPVSKVLRKTSLSTSGKFHSSSVISNCVINLSPSKLRAYQEAHRVLKPGGRVAVADMVALQPLPDHLMNDLAAYTGCLAGAELIDQLKAWLSQAGFKDVEIRVRQRSRGFIPAGAMGNLDNYIASADVTAFKSDSSHQR
jgi:SAM-dependent methyltransferase